MSMKTIRQEQGFTIVELTMVLALLGVFGIMAAPLITDSLDTLRVRAAVDTITSDLRFARRSAQHLNRRVEFIIDNEESLSYTIFDLQTGKALKTVVIGGVQYGAGWSLVSDVFGHGFGFDRRGLPTDLTGQPLGGDLILERSGQVLQGFRIYRTTGFIETFHPGGHNS